MLFHTGDDHRDSRRTWIVLGLLVAVGAALRLFDLGILPNGLYCDEAANGYDAYAILTTGKSLHGDATPLFFLHHGIDYVESLYTYLTVPSIGIFGRSPFSIRLIAALAGTLTIVTTFLLGRQLVGRVTGLLAALLVAVSPWHMTFSRIGFRGILLPLAITFGLYLFLRALGNYRRIIPCALVLGLSLHTYAVAKLLVPITLLILAIMYRSELRTLLTGNRTAQHHAGAGTILFLLLAVPVYWFSFVGEGNRRFEQLSVMSEPYPVGTAFTNYLQHLSPDFLFFSGDANLRHSIPGYGELLIVLFPFLLLGIVAALRIRTKEYSLPPLLFLVGLIPPALTHEGIPHALRAIGAVPFPELTAAIGITFLLRSLKPDPSWLRLSAAGLIGVALFVNAGLFLGSYFGDYRKESQHVFQAGLEEAIEFAETEGADYDQVVISPRIAQAYVFVLFYATPDPTGYQTDRSLGRYIVGNNGRAFPGGSTLVIAAGGESLPGRKPLRIIPALDGTPLLRLYEHNR